MVFPQKNCHFAPSFIFSKKKIKKNALHIIGVLFKDASITIDIVPQLKIFSTFYGVSRLLAKTKVRKD